MKKIIILIIIIFLVVSIYAKDEFNLDEKTITDEINVESMLDSFYDSYIDSLINQAWQYYSEEKKWDALQLIDKVNLAKKTDSGNYLKGVIEYELENYWNAKNYLEEISHDYEYLDRVFNRIGLIYSEISSKPGWDYSRTKGGIKRTWEFDFSQEAKQYFKKAIMVNPEGYIYYFNLALQFLGEGELQNAQINLLKSIDKGDDSDICKYYLAFTYIWHDQEYKAYLVYNDMYDKSSSDAITIKELIPQYFESKQYQTKKSGCL